MLNAVFISLSHMHEDSYGDHESATPSSLPGRWEGNLWVEEDSLLLHVPANNAERERNFENEALLDHLEGIGAATEGTRGAVGAVLPQGTFIKFFKGDRPNPKWEEKYGSL